MPHLFLSWQIIGLHISIMNYQLATKAPSY